MPYGEGPQGGGASAVGTVQASAFFDQAGTVGAVQASAPPPAAGASPPAAEVAGGAQGAGDRSRRLSCERRSRLRLRDRWLRRRLRERFDFNFRFDFREADRDVRFDLRETDRDVRGILRFDFREADRDVRFAGDPEDRLRERRFAPSATGAPSDSGIKLKRSSSFCWYMSRTSASATSGVTSCPSWL